MFGFGKNPILALEITDIGETTGQFTISVRSNFWPDAPPTFSEVLTGAENVRIFTRAVGKGSLTEIEEVLGKWVRQKAVYIPTFRMGKGSRLAIFARADVRVRNQKGKEERSH